MNTYDVKCPHCGHINKNLYLEETDGWMECEKCAQLSSAKMAGRVILPIVCGMQAASSARHATIRI